MKCKTYIILVFFAITMIFFSCCNKYIKNSEVNIVDKYIKDIQIILQNDSIKNIWGVELYGPMMFVNPDTRMVYANKQNKHNSFVKVNDDIYVGYLPSEYNIANTSFTYANEVWTSVIITKNTNHIDRNKLIVHELWHSVQNKIGIHPCMSNNYHINDIDGSILLKLEIIALHAALSETNKDNVKNHLLNALFIRNSRQSIYPDNNENVFECHEGLAEYTAVKSMLFVYGNEYKSVFLEKMLSSLNDRGLSYSFAYTTGPAYGLILDEMYPSWKNLLLSGQTLTDISKLYLSGVDYKVSDNDIKIENIINQYNANELVKKWYDEENYFINNVNRMKNKFINKDLLYIMNNNISFSFNPNDDVVQYGDSAIIYKTMRLSGDFGVLDVIDGIMVSKNWRYFIIPYGHDNKTETYTLDLADEYHIVQMDNKKFLVTKQ